MPNAQWGLPLAALAFVAFGASPSRADHAPPPPDGLVYITYSGTISRGRDDLGLFSQPGTSLDGAAFTARFVADSSSSQTVTYCSSCDPITGESELRNGFRSASLVVLGKKFSFRFGGGFQQNEIVLTNFGADRMTTFVDVFGFVDPTANQNGSGQQFSLFTTSSGLMTPYLRQEFARTISSPFDNGSFSFYEEVATDTDVVVTETSAGLRVTSVRFSLSPPVPEPTTWAMMIGGFGAVGGALRRKRKAVPAAA